MMHVVMHSSLMHSYFRFLFTDEIIDSDKPYDAFISYSHHDTDFVNQAFIELYIIKQFNNNNQTEMKSSFVGGWGQNAHCSFRELAFVRKGKGRGVNNLNIGILVFNIFRKETHYLMFKM